MNERQKMQADLLLLQKIGRNLQALNDKIAIRFGMAIRRRILNEYRCRNAKECIALLCARLGIENTDH